MQVNAAAAGPARGKMVHNMSQDNDLQVEESEEKHRRFDVVRVKYIHLDIVKSIILTKLEPSTSHRQTHIIYKLDRSQSQFDAI